MPQFGRSRAVIASQIKGQDNRFHESQRRSLTSTAQAELDRYFEKIEKRLPESGSRFLRWLRKPSSLLARIMVGVLLILGGIFSFLPVLGIWMLPLGLIIIAQDLPFLQEPLVRGLQWAEAKWSKRR